MSTGVDPEVFVGSDHRSIVIGAKLFPYVASESRKNIVHDNAAVEFRAMTSHCLQGLNGGIEAKIRRIKQKAGVDLKIYPIPAARLPMSDAKDPSVQEFGCDPSFILNEDGEPVEVAPEPEPGSRWRCAGYHIHQSTAKKRNSLGYLTPRVKLADIFLGTLDVMMTKLGGNEDAAKRRRDMGYGHPGEFRQRPFGVEYRTLCPWPLRSPMLAWFCHSAMRQIFSRWSSDSVERRLEQLDWKQARFAIREVNAAEAYDVWREAISTVGEGNSGNNSLTKVNLERMEFIIRNGGWKLTTWGMGVYSRWHEGVNPPMSSGRSSPGPGRYRSKQERYFPSGTDHLIAQPGVSEVWEAFKENYPDDRMNVITSLGWS